MTILAADVGGTNTRVAVFMGDEMRPQHITRFRNAEFSSLQDVLGRYLEGLADVTCSAACVAVAGPVRDGVGRMTNLDWVMDSPTLRAATGAKDAFVINDLEAQGHALEDVDTRCILGSHIAVNPRDSRLVVGLGTGFNAAPVHAVDGGAEFHVVPSECGHVSLPVWDQTSFDLGQSLIRTHRFASVEEALAGRGLLAVNAFVAGSDAHASTTDFIAALTNAPSDSDRATARLFCQILGRVLGDLALIHLPFGGIYLIGGLARAMEPFFAANDLAGAIAAKGRFSDFMKNFPLFIVEDDYAALTGCARYTKRHL